MRLPRFSVGSFGDALGSRTDIGFGVQDVFSSCLGLVEGFRARCIWGFGLILGFSFFLFGLRVSQSLRFKDEAEEDAW